MAIDSIQNTGNFDPFAMGATGVAAEKARAAAEKAGGMGPSQEMRDRTAATTYESRIWNPEETIDFSMGTYTKNGTLVQVEAGSKAFTMGNFSGALGSEATSRFRMTGARADMNLSVTFTTQDGKSKSFTLTESTTFHENEAGEIVEGRGKHNAVKDADNPDDPDKMVDENNIVINLDNDATLVGGNSDDVLINLAEGATVLGNEGDDTIFNMGDKVNLNGGLGDDLIKVVDDVIRDPKKSTIDLEKVDYMGLSFPSAADGAFSSENGLLDLYPPAMVGWNKGTEATITGGDGDDVIDASSAKLERAVVKGGTGNDLIMADILAASEVDAGEGDDQIKVRNALNSSIDGGDGNDAIAVDRLKGSFVSGGDGDDIISVEFMVDSHVDGGKGDDTIRVGKMVGGSVVGGDGDDDILISRQIGGLVDGGDGDDTIRIHQSKGGVVLGGGGDDTILIDDARNSFIAGGTGDDTITILKATGNLISGGKGNDRIFTGIGAKNIIDGGAGEDLIATNVLRPKGLTDMPGGVPLKDRNVDVSELALQLKQTMNSEENVARFGGLTLSAAGWEQLAQDYLNEFGDTDPGRMDIIIDDGQIKDGPADKLGGRLDNFEALIKATGMPSATRNALLSYTASLKKLA